MSDPQYRDPGLYKIVSQLPSFGTDAAGRPGPGVDITITTAGGHTAMVFVPNASYTVEKVRPILADLAATADAIGNLTG